MADMTDRIWLKHYDKGVPTSIDIPTDVTVYSVFEQTAHTYPSHPFLIYCGRTMTYAEVYNDVCQLAGMLHEMEIGVGDRLVLHMPNIPQWVTAYLAGLKIGAIIVPINPLTQEEALVDILKKTAARAVVTITKFLPAIQDIRRAHPLERVFVTNIKNDMGWATRMAFSWLYEKKLGHFMSHIPRDVDDLLAFRGKDEDFWYSSDDSSSDGTALLPCTGGVTGEPKIVELTHRNLVFNALQSVNGMTGFKYGEEVVAGILPLFHIYGLTNVLNAAIMTRSAIALAPDPRDTARVVSLLRKARVTILPCVPILFERMMNEPCFQESITTLKMCISGAAPLDPDLQYRFQKMTNDVPIIQGFGLSEASPTTHCNPVRGRNPEGSIGIPIVNTDAAIMDIESGRILPSGDQYIGEIVVAGPQVMKGYWEDPEATAQVKHGSWLRTGDIGYMDEEGFFFIVGRRKEVILVGGTGAKVYPNRIEKIISHHPHVKECAVVRGFNSVTKEEFPRALIIPTYKPVDSEELIESIRKHCAEQLTSHEMPRVIEIVDVIPRTILGKPLRRQIENLTLQTPST